MEHELEEIKKRLDDIEAILRKLPEIQAAVYFQFKDEYEAARLRGEKSTDIWDIAPPNLR